MRRARPCATAAIVVLAFVTGAFTRPRQARADGAFPDSMQILLPADRPREIVLATNFGLFSSDDDGQTWFWSCEPDTTDIANLYQIGPPPGDRMYAILARGGLVYSDDGACTWTPAQGALASAVASDAFPAPGDPSRVYAIAVDPTSSNASPSVYLSSDSGTTFSGPVYDAPTGAGLLGVESAASDPMRVYLAMYTGPGINPALVGSLDHGATWSAIDLTPMLGQNRVRIAGIDPTDPLKIYLRAIGTTTNALAISADGGATFVEPVTTDGPLTAFVRLASGTVLVASALGDYSAAFRSTDAGTTFQPWPGAPHLRALAERDGRLFAAGDNFRDRLALGVSTDEGMTLKPSLTTYDRVRGIKPCAQDRCADACMMLSWSGLWDASVCSPGGPISSSDGGPPSPGNGCACAVAPAPSLVSAAFAVAALAMAWRRRARRRTRE